MQQADTGTKMIHIGKNTRSRILSKGISAGHGVNSYRGAVTIAPGAEGARNHTQCDSLLIGGDCGPVHGPGDGFPVERYTELVRPVLKAVDLRFANCERQYSSRGTVSERAPHGRHGGGVQQALVALEQGAGETADEVAGAARALRQAMVPVEAISKVELSHLLLDLAIKKLG